MFTLNYIILHLKSFSYSVVNVDLSMAIETYTCQYVFLMEVLTLFQWFSGWLPYYCMLM